MTKRHNNDGYMYCTSCNSSMEAGEVMYDDYPAARYDPAESTAICPVCGDEDCLEDAPWYCSCCDKYYPGYRMSNMTEDMCQECHDSARQRLNKAVEAMGDDALLKLWRDMQEVYGNVC